MAHTYHQIPTPFVPSDTDQHVAITALHNLVQDSETGERAPHETTTHSGITSYVRNCVHRESLEDFENAWHLGNYVIDRQSGNKSIEPMPIYVRLGMYFLYYGSSQAAVLQ